MRLLVSCTIDLATLSACNIFSNGKVTLSCAKSDGFIVICYVFIVLFCSSVSIRLSACFNVDKRCLWRD